jgi:hypothetical protein
LVTNSAGAGACASAAWLTSNAALDRPERMTDRMKRMVMLQMV